MKEKYLITYHNENTGKAIWVSEKYCFETKDPQKYHVMKETNTLLSESRDIDIAHGIRMLLEYDGQPIDKYS
jgi:hypothetical protein